MDIQEIREEIAEKYLFIFGINLKFAKSSNHVELGNALRFADQVLARFAEKEACFPVEGELPTLPAKSYWISNSEDCTLAYEVAQQDMLKAGYTKVITLREMMGGD